MNEGEEKMQPLNEAEIDLLVMGVFGGQMSPQAHALIEAVNKVFAARATGVPWKGRRAEEAEAEAARIAASKG